MSWCWCTLCGFDGWLAGIIQTKVLRNQNQTHIHSHWCTDHTAYEQTKPKNQNKQIASKIPSLFSSTLNYVSRNCRCVRTRARSIYFMLAGLLLAVFFRCVVVVFLPCGNRQVNFPLICICVGIYFRGLIFGRR